MNILEVKNLDIIYQNQEKKVLAVDDLSFAVSKGDSLGIVGESGSGKSTLAMGILKLLPEDVSKSKGEVYFKGTDILKMRDEEFDLLRWKEISVVFQKSMNALSPIHKIGEQFEDIYRVHESKISKSEVKSKIKKLFDLVNLSERVYNLYPHELSGGMMQRASIALSLLHRPPLVILDEATTALDVVTQGQILFEIKKLEKEIEMTRIMITHDMSVVASSCSHVIVMYAGRLMEMGRVKEILTHPMHPYTEGLIKSYPSLKGVKENLRSIPGALPDLSKRVEGCIFYPRCQYKKDICKSNRPEIKVLEQGHQVACHFPKEAIYEQ